MSEPIISSKDEGVAEKVGNVMKSIGKDFAICHVWASGVASFMMAGTISQGVVREGVRFMEAAGHTGFHPGFNPTVATVASVALTASVALSAAILAYEGKGFRDGLKNVGESVVGAARDLGEKIGILEKDESLTAKIIKDGESAPKNSILKNTAQFTGALLTAQLSIAGAVGAYTAVASSNSLLGWGVAAGAGLVAVTGALAVKNAIERGGSMGDTSPDAVAKAMERDEPAKKFDKANDSLTL
ncbi:hypothetical protein ACYPKM_01590 [Pseudomonas aeruginosa]